MKFLISSLIIAVVASTTEALIKDSKQFERPLDEVLPLNVGSGRISNGQNATEGQFSYQVGLLLWKNDGTTAWCSGSLIHINWVLTAAHCTENTFSVDLSMGSIYRDNPEIVVTVNASAIIIHEGYLPATYTNDISLIKTPNITLSSNIQIIDLPVLSSSYPTYTDYEAYISGWGRMGDSATGLATVLQYGLTRIINNAICALSFPFTVTLRNICIGGSPDRVSICQGDYGSALVLRGLNIQVGIASFGSQRGCEKGSPVVFIRVTSFLPWIRDKSGLVL